MDLEEDFIENPLIKLHITRFKIISCKEDFSVLKSQLIMSREGDILRPLALCILLASCGGQPVPQASHGPCGYYEDGPTCSKRIEEEEYQQRQRPYIVTILTARPLLEKVVQSSNKQKPVKIDLVFPPDPKFNHFRGSLRVKRTINANDALELRYNSYNDWCDGFTPVPTPFNGLPINNEGSCHYGGSLDTKFDITNLSVEIDGYKVSAVENYESSMGSSYDYEYPDYTLIAELFTSDGQVATDPSKVRLSPTDLQRLSVNT